VNINQPLNKSEATTNAFTTKKVKYYNLSYSTTNLLSLMPFHRAGQFILANRFLVCPKNAKYNCKY